MESLTTKEAATLAGVTVRQWHYLAEREHLTPVAAAPGKRGVKFWTLADVRHVQRQAAA